MAYIFHRNPRVCKIRESLSNILPVGPADIIAEYAWHTERDKLAFALMELSQSDGSGRIIIDPDGPGWFQPLRYELFWSSRGDDYENKEYLEIIWKGWSAHPVSFENLLPDAPRWRKRDRRKTLHAWDRLADQYRAIMEPLMARY